MRFANGVYTQYDLEAAKILNDFLPERIFDAHIHLFDSTFAPGIAKGGGSAGDGYYLALGKG